MSEQTARQDSAEQALAALNESDAAISAIYSSSAGWARMPAPPTRSGTG